MGSSDVISKQLHLAVHAENAIHGEIFVVVGDWRLDKSRNCIRYNRRMTVENVKIDNTYIFLWRSVVELIWLDSHSA